ncbi:ABC transporter ATP-binding protein [Leuconostoc pseudomesenteroides]|uniref:ABC transporter ATP-binding protein n=1 Tax=Leuconostoc pseudomesenteroides TaxID=33968 RepID=UPI0039ED3177
MEKVIELKNVDKHFGTNHVLNKISLTINSGQLVGLIGPSGAGKSTLIAAMLGMLRLDGGQVRLLNSDMPNRSALQNIGYMAQNDALYGNLTGLENLSFFGKIMGLSRSVLTDKIHLVSQTVDLQDHLDLRVSQYSGGMKRRLSLAIALLSDAPLLILDEPTVGIDPELRIKIWQELDKLHQQGKTVLITTHVMSEIETVDRLLMLRDGHIIADNTPTFLEKQYQVTNIESVFIKAGERYENNSHI